jgi:hypothetical protein
LLGTSFVNTDIELEVNPSSVVVTDVLDDENFKNIVLQVKANDTLAIGGVFSVLFFFQDLDNYYEYRIDTANRTLSLYKTVSGVSSQIAPTVTADIVPKASYIFTIQTSRDELTNDTLLQTFLDSNRIHNVLDGSFEKGKFGFKTYSNTTLQTGEVEMIELPLDVRRILPGFNL